jgi:hypothetical protein
LVGPPAWAGHHARLHQLEPGEEAGDLPRAAQPIGDGAGLVVVVLGRQASAST